MSLISCPECGHEVSVSATACPNCGRPIRSTTVFEPVQRSSVPPWAFVVIGVAAVVIIFLAFLALRQEQTADTGLNVNVESRRATDTDRVSGDRSTDSGTDVPRGSVPSQAQTIPGTGGEVSPPDRGAVTIRARVKRSGGETRPVSGTKFYLLDKDLQEILAEADVDPVEGNSILGSVGLAAVFPDRYRDFQRAAEKAIAKHVKYSVTTGSDGSADISEIKPDSYYIFGIAKVGNGFALWSSPVSVIAGQNDLDLAPQNVTNVPAPAG